MSNGLGTFTVRGILRKCKSSLEIYQLDLKEKWWPLETYTVESPSSSLTRAQIQPFRGTVFELSHLP
jgi:hypothetical protein